jgi:hypothetical protein
MAGTAARCFSIQAFQGGYASPFRGTPSRSGRGAPILQRPADSSDGDADAVFLAAFDNAIAVGNINQNVAIPVEKANCLERFED